MSEFPDKLSCNLDDEDAQLLFQLENVPQKQEDDEDIFQFIQFINEEEDEEDAEPTEYEIFRDKLEAMERTEWFPAKVNPVRDGRYEVERKEWPFPHWAMFENGKWEDEELIEDDKVTRWRGTTEASLKIGRAHV